MTDAPVMLSLSGLRGVVGRSLFPQTAQAYGAALGQWFNAQPGADSGAARHVVVGRDSRTSGPQLETAVVKGLAAAGCGVTRLGIASTPGVAVMAEHLHADGGVVITASHNPAQWNGIKALRRDGAAPTAAQAATIIELFKQLDQDDSPCTQSSVAAACDHSVVAVHAKRVLAHVDVDAIRRMKLRVVLDSVHGAAGPETAALLEQLDVELIHLYAEPTGQFPHAPEPTKANLTGLGQAVRQHKADLGFAQDPDGDRLAVVDQTGAYIGEEYTLVLAAWHVLSGTDADAEPIVVTNLSSSRLLDDVAARTGAQVLRTPVGEANVADAMRQHRAPIGGEGNGGVIWPCCTYVRNSLAGIALLLELLAVRGTSASQIVAALPRYAMTKQKIELSEAGRAELLDGLAPKLSDRFDDALVNLEDGVRLDWPDRWVHVRASNTEPILRIIAEAPTEPNAAELVQKVRQALDLA
jgi:phosphomannomutase